MTGWRYFYRIQRLIALRPFGRNATQQTTAESKSLSLGEIFQTWLPLAATWMLMTAEGPLLAAFVARQVAPELNLAAWSIVFPLVLILAAPGITLLSASTALVKDLESFNQMRRYVFGLIVIVLVLHALLAFTPAYDFFVNRIMGIPPELFEPVRIGLQIMIPFSAVLSYRRFANGVLIRFGRANTVTIGAVLRLMGSFTTLVICTWIGGVAGVVGATLAITVAVIVEFAYATIMVNGIVESDLRPAPAMEEKLTFRSFTDFYLPLVLTTMIYIFVQPMIASALGRLPDPISSLAGWPVLYGIVMLVASGSFAFTEVAVVMLDRPNAHKNLIRFTLLMGGSMATVLLIFNATALADWWLVTVAALPTDLVQHVRDVLWFAIPLPAFHAADSLFSGALMNGRRTRAVTEGALVSIITLALVLVGGVLLGSFSGLLVGLFASLIGGMARTFWLWRRARELLA